MPPIEGNTTRREFLCSAIAEEHSPQRRSAVAMPGDAEFALPLDRDKMVFSGSDACEEPISTRWQLDLITDLKANFEGARCGQIRTHTCVLIEDKTVSRKRYDADDCPWRRTFSNAQTEWQISSDNVCRAFVRGGQIPSGRK